MCFGVDIAFSISTHCEIFHDVDHVIIRCDDYDFMLSLIRNYFGSETNINHCDMCTEYCQALTKSDDFNMFMQTKERMQTAVILKATPFIVSYVHQKRRTTTMTTSSKPVIH